MRCECCGIELTGNTQGCNVTKIVVDGRSYSRIPWNGYMGNTLIGDFCPDCGAPKNSYHHWSCDVEICPVCGEQLLMHIICNNNCKFGKIESVESPFRIGDVEEENKNVKITKVGS